MTLNNVGLRWLIALSGLLVIIYFTIPSTHLGYDRALIQQGEIWRIVTGNLMHTNGWHLLLNLAGLSLLFLLFQDYLDNHRLPVLMLLLCSGVGFGIWLTNPQTHWYMGLSGPLHGLFVWGAVQDIRHGRVSSGWMMLAGAAVKIAMDFYYPGESPVAGLIEARIHIESHLMGAGVGLLLTLSPHFMASCEATD